MFGEAIYGGNTLHDWLTALLISAAVLLVLWLILRLLLQRLTSFAQTTQTEIDDLIAHVGSKTKLGLLVIPALYAGSCLLNLPEEVRTWFRVLAGTSLLIQVGIWGDAIITFWLEGFRQARGAEADRVTMVSAVSFVFRLLLYGLLVILALDNIPGVQATALLGSLGIGGIAIALAVQSILGDLFASLSIALDRPFVLGDHIQIGDEAGTVEYIGLRTTRLRRLSGEELVVGNNDLLSSRIRNFGRMGQRRVVFSFGVAAETPYEKVEGIPGMMREIIGALPKVRFARAHLVRVGGSSLDYEVVYFVLDPDNDLYMDTQQAINLSMVRRLAEEGIQIPCPTQTVRLAYLQPAKLENEQPPGAEYTA